MEGVYDWMLEKKYGENAMKCLHKTHQLLGMANTNEDVMLLFDETIKNSSSDKFDIDKLPDDMLGMIIGMLDSVDRIALCSVSARFRGLCQKMRLGSAYENVSQPPVWLKGRCDRKLKKGSLIITFYELAPKTGKMLELDSYVLTGLHITREIKFKKSIKIGSFELQLNQDMFGFYVISELERDVYVVDETFNFKDSFMEWLKKKGIDISQIQEKILEEIEIEDEETPHWYIELFARSEPWHTIRELATNYASDKDSWIKTDHPFDGEVMLPHYDDRMTKGVYGEYPVFSFIKTPERSETIYHINPNFSFPIERAIILPKTTRGKTPPPKISTYKNMKRVMERIATYMTKRGTPYKVDAYDIEWAVDLQSKYPNTPFHILLENINQLIHLLHAKCAYMAQHRIISEKLWEDKLLFTEHIGSIRILKYKDSAIKFEWHDELREEQSITDSLLEKYINPPIFTDWRLFIAYIPGRVKVQ